MSKPEKENYDVVKSNALIEAAYNPGNLWEMRVLMACLSQIKGKEKLDHNRILSVSANALADITGTAAKSSYGSLRRAMTELRDKYLTIHLTPEGAPARRRDINFVNYCDYIEAEGRVELTFSPAICPYISQLHKNFTKIMLAHVMPMKSGYGIRLYELCLQWLGDEREFAVDDFRRIMGLENKYPEIGDLKKRVIWPAIKDINKFTNLRVRFGQRKHGRVVTHLQFKITHVTVETVASTTARKALPTRTPPAKKASKRSPEEIQRAADIAAKHLKEAMESLGKGSETG